MAVAPLNGSSRVSSRMTMATAAPLAGIGIQDDRQRIFLGRERTTEFVRTPNIAGSASTTPQSPTAAATPCVPIAGVNDKCPDWTTAYDGPGAGFDESGLTTLISRIAAVSGDGKTIYTAAKSDADPDTTTDYDFAVVAYDAATGAQRWVSRYAGTPDFPKAAPVALVVDPSGTRVIVTGTVSTEDDSVVGVATVAFAANDGHQIWETLFQEQTLTTTTDLALSPDGKRVFVPCQVYYQDGEGVRHSEAVVVAYDTATGLQRWLSRYSGDPGDRTFAQKVVTHPDGATVYAAVGKVDDEGFASDIILVIYDSLTGALKRETHHLTQGFLIAGMAMSPDGSRVFIEQANYFLRRNAALTIAYDAAGNELWWTRTFGCDANGCASRPWYNEPIVVSADGSQVFVSTLQFNPQTEVGFMTFAYDAATGEQKWATRYEGTSRADCFCSPPVTINPNGQEVYVSGLANFVAVLPGTVGGGVGDTTTLAYDAGTGAQKWAGIYAPANGNSAPSAIAVSPYDDRVFVAGYQRDAASGNLDLFTLTYPTGITPTLRPISAHSRKIHSGSGVFDLNLPLAGRTGLECRTEPTPGDHHIAFRFASAVTVTTATVTPGAGHTGQINGPPIVSSDGKEVVVDLANVSNAQLLNLTLSGVSDGTHTSDVSSSLRILTGDTNGDGAVNSADIAQTKSQSGQVVGASNFRQDVNVDGSLNSADISLVKSKSGTALTPQAQPSAQSQSAPR